MIRLFCFLILLNTTQVLSSQGKRIIVSPIGPQEVYEGARITIYFSTLRHLPGTTFSSINLPDFAQLFNDGNGDGRIVVDPLEGDGGEYFITLNTENGSDSNVTTFKLDVVGVDEEKSQIYYIDPEKGKLDAMGTYEDPFLDLESFLSQNTNLITDSTFIFLRDGFHGSPVFTGTRNKPVKVLAEAGHIPKFKKLSFSFTTNWYISGFDISPENAGQTDIENLVTVFSGSTEIEISNCKIYPIEDASVWTTNEMWYQGSGNGIISSGTKCLFRNNFLKNTWFSVEMKKPYNEFSYNIINWFGADAIRTIANYQTVSYNQVKNATVYDYDHPTRPQHDDGIQSWTFNNPVKGVRIIGNQVVDIADPNLPLPTEVMQGIVDFDGFAEDWTVENNLVITHHAHGIALYGAKNCRVVNNTIVRNPLNYFTPNFQPWIRINPRKVTVGGDLSLGNLVRNNIMASYQDEGLEPASVDHNIISSDYLSIFEDYEGWNFHLADNSIAIDAGAEESTVDIDQEMRRRNVGQPDAGCFEYNASLIDLIKPSMPSNILGEVDQTRILLNWTESQDNTGVSHYLVIVDGQRELCTNVNSIQVSGLEPERAYEIDIVAVDYFGNTSAKAQFYFVTEPEGMINVHHVPAHRHDQLIKSNLRFKWIGMENLNIGGFYGSQMSAAVIPFQLPCISDDRVVSKADVHFYISDIVNNPEGSIDLYNLGIRSKSDLSTEDFWTGPSNEDSPGQLISDGFISNSDRGFRSLDSLQIAHMGDMLQGVYEQGACNKFLFIRLNINSQDTDNGAYYSVAASENKDSELRPLLSFVSTTSSSTKPFEVFDGLELFPNPVYSSHLRFRISDFITDNAIFEIYNSIGQLAYGERINVSDNTSYHSVNILLPAGTYFASIRDRGKFAHVKFIKR